MSCSASARSPPLVEKRRLDAARLLDALRRLLLASTSRWLGLSSCCSRLKRCLTRRGRRTCTAVWSRRPSLRRRPIVRPGKHPYNLETSFAKNVSPSTTQRQRLFARLLARDRSISRRSVCQISRSSRSSPSDHARPSCSPNRAWPRFRSPAVVGGVFHRVFCRHPRWSRPFLSIRLGGRCPSRLLP